MRLLAVTGCCVAAIVLLVAEDSSLGAAVPGLRAKCTTGAVPAVVAGQRVCLKAGRRCSPKREAVYRRYGFTCSRQGVAGLVRSQLARSLYLSVPEDRRVDEQTVVLAAPVELPKPDALFVEANGTFWSGGE